MRSVVRAAKHVLTTRVPKVPMTLEEGRILAFEHARSDAASRIHTMVGDIYRLILDGYLNAQKVNRFGVALPVESMSKPNYAEHVDACQRVPGVHFPVSIRPSGAMSLPVGSRLLLGEMVSMPNSCLAVCDVSQPVVHIFTRSMMRARSFQPNAVSSKQPFRPDLRRLRTRSLIACSPLSRGGIVIAMGSPSIVSHYTIKGKPMPAAAITIDAGSGKKLRSMAIDHDNILLSAVGDGRLIRHFLSGACIQPLPDAELFYSDRLIGMLPRSGELDVCGPKRIEILAIQVIDASNDLMLLVNFPGHRHFYLVCARRQRACNPLAPAYYELDYFSQVMDAPVTDRTPALVMAGNNELALFRRGQYTSVSIFALDKSRPAVQFEMGSYDRSLRTRIAGVAIDSNGMIWTSCYPHRNEDCCVYYYGPKSWTIEPEGRPLLSLLKQRK